MSKYILPTRIAASGDWKSDCESGRSLGRTLLAQMVEDENPTVLGHAVRSLMEANRWSGVEAGFLHAFAEAAIR